MEPDDLTPVWFSSVLAVDISAVKCTPIGVGMVGLNLRCELVGDGRHPTSVLVKLPSADPTSRATGVSLRNYEREVKFYDEIAPTVGIRAPRCYHGSWDAASGYFVLVLEDAAPAEPGDQIKGCWWSQAQADEGHVVDLHGLARFFYCDGTGVEQQVSFKSVATRNDHTQLLHWFHHLDGDWADRRVFPIERSSARSVEVLLSAVVHDAERGVDHPTVRVETQRGAEEHLALGQVAVEESIGRKSCDRM